MAVCSHRLKRPRSGSKEPTSQEYVADDNAEVTLDMVGMQTGGAHSENVCTTRSEILAAGLEVQGSGTDVGNTSQEALDDSERRKILESKWALSKHCKLIPQQQPEQEVFS